MSTTLRRVSRDGQSVRQASQGPFQVPRTVGVPCSHDVVVKIFLFLSLAKQSFPAASLRRYLQWL